MIGKVIGNYKVTAKLGAGGMGSVYRATDVMLERDAAIKVLHPELARQPQVVERFKSEAKVLAKLSHPNIATVFSLFQEGEDLFMVLEFVPGKTLEQILEELGSLSLNEAAGLFTEVLAGVEHAHALGVIHRDIKPANLILSDHGMVKVMDFGIARIVGSARMTREGHVVGTLEYMSPEQVQQGEADERSDVYSLGIVLYEMLSGRLPFKGDSDYAIMKAQLEATPVGLRELVPDLPEPVEQVVLAALDKEPEKRIQTVADLRTAFGEAVEEAGKTGSAKAPAATRVAADPKAATRLAGTRELAQRVKASDSGAKIPVDLERWKAFAARSGGQLLAKAKTLPWQAWVIVASVGILLIGMVSFWPSSGGSGRSASAGDGAAGNRGSVPRYEVDTRETPSQATGAGSGAEPGYTDPPPQPSVPAGGSVLPKDKPLVPKASPPTDPGPNEPTVQPAPAPYEPVQPEPSRETEEKDFGQPSPLERFVDNYAQIERLSEDLEKGAGRFEESYRKYLKRQKKWKPKGSHGRNWDQLEGLQKATKAFQKDVEDFAERYGLLDNGRMKRWWRSTKKGAGKVTGAVTGREEEAEVGLNQLRRQAANLDQRAGRIASGLQASGVSSDVRSEWSGLSQKAKRLSGLF